MSGPLRITIYDTSIDRTEEYERRWLTTDMYSKLLRNPEVGECDLIGLNDCFGYRFGVIALPLFAVIWIFEKLPFFKHLSKYLFLAIIFEGRYLGLWKHDPKTGIANHHKIEAKYTAIAPEFRYPRRSVEDSGILVLINKASTAVSVVRSEYVAFALNDDSECGFVAVTLQHEGQQLLWIHARLASRPALEAKAFFKGYFSAARREKYISEVLQSESKEIVGYVRSFGERPEIILSGDLNVGSLSNPSLQELIALLDLRPGREVVTDVWDNTTFFPTAVQKTQTYLLLSKDLDYVTYKTLPEASFERSESLVLYTEVRRAAAG